MARTFAVIAASCIAIASIIFGAAGQGDARPFGGGGFGGGHFGGAGGGPSFHGFGGGQFGAPRAGGFGGRPLQAPSTAPHFVVPNTGRFAGSRGAFSGFRSFSGRPPSSGFGNLRGVGGRPGVHANRFAREQHDLGDRVGRNAGGRLTARGENRGLDRGLDRGLGGHLADTNHGAGRAGDIGRHRFAQFNERRVHPGAFLSQRGSPPQSFARTVHPQQTIGAHGLLNSAAFRRGNGFENPAFGGGHWRGREGRFRHFWTGGVFWPFLFGDYLSYAFWPGAYYEPFWSYGPDAILWGSLWPESAYGGEDYAAEGIASEGGNSSVPAIGGEYAGTGGSTQMAALCSGFAPGVVDLPVARFEQILLPAPEQRAALDELKAAFAKAARVLQASCPNQTPVTPLARLDAMEQQLAAMQQAVTIIRAPLERLFGLLTEVQIARLEDAANKREKPLSVNVMELCSGKSDLTKVPADEIARAIKLTDEQQFDLDKLKQASARAADELRASCPKKAPPTIEARLQDAHTRIASLIQAIEIIRPAIGSFYASLSSQQKTALSEQGKTSRSARR